MSDGAARRTPGPWEVQVLEWMAGQPIQIGHDGWGPIAEMRHLATPREEQLANARLIAAAPELLRACILARLSLRSAGVEQNLILDALDSAIAKAGAEARP